MIAVKILPGRRKSYTGELSKTAKRRLRGIESETKVFLSVVFVCVCGFMMVRVGTADNPGDSFVFAHADRGNKILKAYRVRACHVRSDR